MGDKAMQLTDAAASALAKVPNSNAKVLEDTAQMVRTLESLGVKVRAGFSLNGTFGEFGRQPPIPAAVATLRRAND